VNAHADGSLLGALLLGLFGGLHCIGMCGGIAASLGGLLGAQNRPRLHLVYNAGRITSYCIAGGVAGGLGLSVASVAGHQGIVALRVVAGFFLVAIGLHLAGWWRGLNHLERLGQHLWRRISPLGARLRPLDRGWKIALFGMVWGWLPCGLVYTALAGAMASGGAAPGALFMACFGIGTLPALLASGAFAETLQRAVATIHVRWAAGALLIGFGIWTIAAASSLPSHHTMH